jgi:hypothetical protein
MRKYLSAGDNSIRILCKFFSMENILSYPVKYEKNIRNSSYFENIFPIWIKMLPKE